MKNPFDTVSKIPISARDWSHMPMMRGVFCLLNVSTVVMWSLKCTLHLLGCLDVGVSKTGVVISRRQ